MCYAIPGKVTQINDNIVSVDYFGEIKKARNEFYKLSPGDYIYAQGGFVIEKITEKDARPILEAWRELFSKLQETDTQFSSNPKNLYQRANYIRHKQLGNACCVHGILEFSNYCCNDCLYCGIQNANTDIKRYRMDIKEIVDACDYAVNKLGFKALVLQSGEDPWYDAEKLVEVVNKVREKCATLLVMSIGEQGIETYKRLYQAGARGVLLRFETSNPKLYEKYRPGHWLKDRIELINKLNKLGFLIMTGFLIGLPGQTQEDILKDIDLTASLGAEMFSFGPFIPHPGTPLANELPGSLELVLNTIANARIKYPDSKILVSTAVETLDKENALKQGLLSGANSLMINITPAKYQQLYEIYPKRAGIDLKIIERINIVRSLLYSIGRAPVDFGV